MTISIGDRIRHAIDDVARGEFELALQHACIAIDITAKRHFKSDRSSGMLYKKLLDEYAWIIELMSMGGINLGDTVFSNFLIDGNAEPKFSDIIYHVVRWNLVHDEGVPANLIFAEGDRIAIANGTIVLPKKVIEDHQGRCEEIDLPQAPFSFAASAR
jgi:hypothetical protein